MTSERLPVAKERLRYMLPTSVTELLRGNVPRQKSYGSREAEKTYDRFVSLPLVPTVVTTPGQETEIFVTTPPLTGRELTHFFHFAAPSKRFGVDAGDTIYDWDKLYSNPDYEELLESHRMTIEGWSEFEPYREQLLQLITFSYNANADSVVVPVIHLGGSLSTGFEWDFDDLDRKKSEALERRLASLKIPKGKLLPILGPIFVAAYSPTITSSWGIYRTMDGERYSKYEKGTQHMGSTQVLPLAIGEADSLLAGPLIQRLLKYVTN